VLDGDKRWYGAAEEETFVQGLVQEILVRGIEGAIRCAARRNESQVALPGVANSCLAGGGGAKGGKRLHLEKSLFSGSQSRSARRRHPPSGRLSDIEMTRVICNKDEIRHQALIRLRLQTAFHVHFPIVLLIFQNPDSYFARSHPQLFDNQQTSPAQNSLLPNVSRRSSMTQSIHRQTQFSGRSMAIGRPSLTNSVEYRNHRPCA
jgi:hypothetical protein